VIEPQNTSGSPIVFALDFATLEDARRAATVVAPAIGMLKVGLELFIEAGPPSVALGRELGLPIFLDLKLHDIPETVERAVARASHLGARVVTVHASGGRAMLKRAVLRAKQEGDTLAICAVTILTSLDDCDLDDIGMFMTRRLAPVRPEEMSQAALAATSLAKMAYEEGVRWFVCSGREVAGLRAALGPDAVLVIPGIRPAASSDDQKRVTTPERALRDGASWLVVGRPIRDAADPLAAAQAIASMAARAARAPE
jgi:orotidine-5'-phosphate decarboxylase